MRNKAFTLIELLSVIVILAIIALIATPIVLNIIKDTKESAFKESVNGVVNGIKLNSLKHEIGDDITYKYENNSWKLNDELLGNGIQFDGSIPKYAEIKVNKEGNIRYAINDGEYCALKEYNSDVIIKNIGSKNTEKEIKEDYCKLDAIETTDESCFKTSNNNNGTLTISGYYNYQGNNSSNDKCPKDVIIPDEIDGKIVTKIGKNSFMGHGLTSVAIPDSVTHIQSSAFYNNHLTSITIPDSITYIGENAFSFNDLTSVIIPNKVASIGYGAFQSNCLTSIIISNSVTSIDGAAFNNNKLPDNQAFIYARKKDGGIDYTTIIGYGGEKRDNVVIPSEINGIKLTTIGHSAFRSNDLTSITIPNNVINIGYAAFSYNDLTSITIPNNVTSIGNWAFSSNDLTSVTIPDSVTSIGDYAFYINKLTSVIIKGKTSISDFISFGNEVFSWDNATSCTGNDIKCITFQSE